MAMECAPDWFPNYDDLPMEIILHIFRFLDHTDLQAAGLTCTRFRDALLHSEFNRSTLVRLAKICLSDRLAPASCFIKSQRPFQNFSLEEVTFGQVHEFMSHIGESAIQITFDNVDLAEKQFYATMRQLPHLRLLNITRCSPLFMSGSFLDNTMVDLTFASIKYLALRYNQYLSDAIFLRLTALIKAIDTLDMTGCHIAYHNAIHRRFYPNIDTASPSESILTFKFIMQVLAQHRTHLRELNFSHTMIGGPALSEMENVCLKLLRLRLKNCRQLNTRSVKSFLQTQPQLLVLDLSDTICVTDDCVEAIVRATPLLEELNFSGCSSITSEGAALLNSLKHLRRLDISHCDAITSEGITLGIALARNIKLQELNASYLKLCEESVRCIARNLPELRILNLGHCGNSVTDDAVQCLIANLRWLRELSLEDCFKITDAALTGINIGKYGLQQQQQPQRSGSLENFNPPPASSIAERESLNEQMRNVKISLRSKAEEEIVRDANRKKAMLAVYELNLIDEPDIKGVNIQQLRGLKVLNLKGCNHITDVSLKYGLKFLELQQLSLSNCQQISLVGMETMVLNCPSIEELDLSDCYNINDSTIKVLTTKLKRLHALHISGCVQLTDHSLDAILVNCKCLQTLSVYRCRLMYTDIEERLLALPTLRNLNIDNTQSMDNVEIFRLKKRLDY